MRSHPLTVREGCALQQRMLEHFNLTPPKMSSSETLKGFKVRRLPRKTEQALEASEVLFALLDDPIAHDIQSANDAVNEIRYSMGFSWLAWMFARYFITELIKWLWEEYHRESTPIPSSPSILTHSSCTEECSDQCVRDCHKD